MFGFESFLANNMWLENEHEVIRHIAKCVGDITASGVLLEEWGDTTALEHLFTPEYVIDHIVESCADSWDARPLVTRIVSALSTRELQALALRGDPYSFTKLPRCMGLLATALGGAISEADPKHLAKHHPEGKAALEELYRGLSTWVRVSYVPHDLPRRSDRMKRRSVLLVDTDSNFITLNRWMEHLSEIFDTSGLSEEEELTCLNAAVYFLRLFSDQQMFELTTAMGVPEDKRHLIEFKSEYVVEVMVLTEGKKNYVCMNTHVEGVKIPGGEVVLKGLSLKKSTVARSTGSFFQKSIESHILRVKTPDRVALVRDIATLEDRIRTVVANGGTDFATPAVVGNISAYADASAMPVVRGLHAWNAARVDDRIREGDRVVLFRSVIGNDRAKMEAEVEKWPEGSEERIALTAILGKFFGTALLVPDETLVGHGFNWLAAPKNVTTLPQWAHGIVSVNEVVQANVAPILPLLNAVGVTPIFRPDPETYSNVCSF